jgi:predicted secreted protein
MSEITGKGTIFNRWNGAEWVAIANVKSISGPTATRETVDTTTLDTPGGYRTFIASLRDAGDISLPMNFTVAGYTAMKSDFESDTIQKYQIVLPDTGNTTLEIEGLVTDLPLEVPVDDVVTCDVTIKISGEVTLTALDIAVSVATISDIDVANGTQLADASLPSTATVTWDDSSTSSVDVTWDAGTPIYDGGTAGAYVFVGTLTMSATQLNPNNVTAEVTINVAS